MRRNEIVRKNIELHEEWLRYVFEHPEVLDKIPKGAELILVPNNDSLLARENEKTVKELKAKGLPFVLVHLDLPKPPVPQIEVVMA